MAKKTSWDRVRVRMKTGGGHHWYSSAKAVAFRYFSRVTVSSLQNENCRVLISVVDPDSLNLDPDMDPDPGF
jgi:hypothetical protein